MAHYTGQIADSGIEALQAILSDKPVWEILAPEVTARFGNAPHEVDQLVFTIGREDFVILTTYWITTQRGFDYHVYIVERSKEPGRVPYYPHGDTKRFPGSRGLPHFGPTSSLEIRLGAVERIEIIEAQCTTTDDSDDDPETIHYDYGLQFFGTEGSMLLTTSFDSIRGAIEIRKGAEPELNLAVDRLHPRLLLDRKMPTAKPPNAQLC